MAASRSVRYGGFGEGDWMRGSKAGMRSAVPAYLTPHLGVKACAPHTCAPPGQARAVTRTKGQYMPQSLRSQCPWLQVTRGAVRNGLTPRHCSRPQQGVWLFRGVWGAGSSAASASHLDQKAVGLPSPGRKPFWSPRPGPGGLCSWFGRNDASRPSGDQLLTPATTNARGTHRWPAVWGSVRKGNVDVRSCGSREHTPRARHRAGCLDGGEQDPSPDGANFPAGTERMSM